MDSDSDDDLPAGWEERATIDGNIYYVNHTDQSTQWIHPRTGKKKCVSSELPFGWKKIVDAEGKISFYNDETDVTTLSDPRLAFSYEVDKNGKDIRYKFDGSTKALEVLHGVDLSNKVAVVTGANTGIGYETAYSLSVHGCHVIFACRNMDSAEKAIENVRKARPKSKCTALKLDLASLTSVEEFAMKLKEITRRVDILILNAGVFGLPYTVTGDGYETKFQVCHLSHHYLTTLLEPLLTNGMYSRVVVLSSESHRFANLSLENIDKNTLSPSANKYSSLMAYNNVKLCNVLFANALHRKLYGKGVNVYAVHPGNLVLTDLFRNWFIVKLLAYIIKPFTKSLQQAASTTVFCAAHPQLQNISGVYYNNCFPCKPSSIAMNEEMADKLWSLTEKFISEFQNKSEI